MGELLNLCAGAGDGGDEPHFPTLPQVKTSALQPRPNNRDLRVDESGGMMARSDRTIAAKHVGFMKTTDRQ